MNFKNFMLVLCCTLVWSTTLFAQISGTKPLVLLSRYNSPGKSPIVLGDTLGMIGFRGWLSSNQFHQGAGIYAVTTDAPTANGVGMRMTFVTGATTLSDRMTILENGFVGINTNAPAYQLHVNGDAFISGDFTVGGDFKVLGSIEAGLDVIAGRDVKAGRNVEAAENVSGKNVLASQNVTATGDVSGKNVLAAQDVTATGNLNGTNVNASNNVTATGTVAATNVNASNVITATGNITSLSTVSGQNLNATNKITAGNNLFVNGRIGIGIDPDSAPGGYDLYVTGTAIAEEVKVKLQASWPDYVFESNRALPSLQEINQFVKANKHLPGVPTAAEVAENGLSVGETQRVMMEKIEELYLHVIEMEQRIKQLETENQALKAQQNK